MRAAAATNNMQQLQSRGRCTAVRAAAATTETLHKLLPQLRGAGRCTAVRAAAATTETLHKLLPQRFAELASTESHCSSAKRGGDLGPFKCAPLAMSDRAV